MNEKRKESLIKTIKGFVDKKDDSVIEIKYKDDVNRKRSDQEKINESLEKRIADLERQIQSQQEIIKLHIKNHEEENKELKKIFEDIKRLAYQ